MYTQGPPVVEMKVKWVWSRRPTDNRKFHNLWDHYSLKTRKSVQLHLQRPLAATQFYADLEDMTFEDFHRYWRKATKAECESKRYVSISVNDPVMSRTTGELSAFMSKTAIFVRHRKNHGCTGGVFLRRLTPATVMHPYISVLRGDLHYKQAPVFLLERINSGSWLCVRYLTAIFRWITPPYHCFATAGNNGGLFNRI